MTSVWVTGAAGFTGSFLIPYLQSLPDNIHVTGLDLARPPAFDADDFIELDLCNAGDMTAAVERHRPDVVFHLAGLMPPHDEAAMRRVNVAGSVNLAKALAASRDKTVRLVSAGSAAEYLPGAGTVTESSAAGGVSAYGRSKAEQTATLLRLGDAALHVIVARPFNLLGPGMTANLVAGALCQQFRTLGRTEGYIAPKGPVESVRDFIDVRDVVSAYWTLARKGEPGQIYNVCTGSGTSIAEVIDILEDVYGFEVETRPDYDASRIREDTVVGDNSRLVALGWRPTIPLRQSLHDMVVAEDRA